MPNDKVGSAVHPTFEEFYVIIAKKLIICKVFTLQTTFVLDISHPAFCGEVRKILTLRKKKILFILYFEVLFPLLLPAGKNEKFVYPFIFISMLIKS